MINDKHLYQQDSLIKPNMENQSTLNLSDK
jgi:hypothetical protein